MGVEEANISEGPGREAGRLRVEIGGQNLVLGYRLAEYLLCSTYKLTVL